MKFARLLAAILLLCLSASSVVGPPVLAAEFDALLRRPVALVEASDGQRLFVANRDCGSVSVIDLQQLQVVAEHTAGNRLADLVARPGSSELLAVDEGAHELIVLQPVGNELQIKQRLAVSPYPVNICVSPDGKQATVASLWSRRLTFVDLAETPAITAVLDLPFAPRCQLLLPNGKPHAPREGAHLAERDVYLGRLLVADSFSGRLALIDPTSRKLVAIREFPGHNVRGLGVSPDGKMLLVAHQMLNELAHSIRNDIHWGLLMSNDLRWLKTESVLAGGKELYQGAHMHPLGEAGKGGGDPGGIDVAADGTVCVAISGVDQVAIGREGDFSMQRVNVGRRPTDVCIDRSGRTAFVANTLADSICVIDLERRELAGTISLGPTPPLSLAQQGELLFHDAKLSHDGWMSCHSCHTDGHANGQMNDNFSDRSFGAPKRVLSLLGVKDTLPLAWSGQVTTLERQIHNSVENTMQREETLAKDQVQAIAAYVKTLEPPPPLDVLRGTQDSAALERGRLVFANHDCGRCHAPPTFTTPETYDVGLKDSQGVKAFNPPSLRGLSHREPYFHDNRAATLEEVFLEHGHPSEAEYSADEVRDLAAYLRSL